MSPAIVHKEEGYSLTPINLTSYGAQHAPVSSGFRRSASSHPQPFGQQCFYVPSDVRARDENPRGQLLTRSGSHFTSVLRTVLAEMEATIPRATKVAASD